MDKSLLDTYVFDFDRHMGFWYNRTEWSD